MLLHLLEKGKGSMEINDLIFNFSYDNSSAKKIIIDLSEELENPILQLVALEKKVKDLNYEEIEILVLKKNKATLNFLLDSTYLIKNGTRQRITFNKVFTEKKSIRLSLTENCNYRCFFCHEEGMDMSLKRTPKNSEEMCNLLMKMKELNYQDLTFTGGEPLVAKSELIKYMDFMEENDYLPDLTIVTNGYLIDTALIDRIKKYKGKFKFNFSMHSVDKESYFKIVKPINNDEDAFNKVVKNIKLIRENNIPLKMNFVILNGINNSAKYIKKILDFAHDNGAFCVKFLELLVTNKLDKYYNFFYSLESIKKDFENDLILENITYRRKEYLYKDNLLVEFQRCTCANGCNLCPLNREINITPQMNYYPCFILSKNKIDVNSENIVESLEKGDKVIEELISKYGSESPVIIKNIKDKTQKSEYIYNSYLSQNEIENELLKNGFVLDRQRTFHDYIYFNNNDNSVNFYEKLVKLTKNTYEGHYREVIQNRKFNHVTNACDINFITSGKIINNIQEYELYLNHLGLKKKFEIFWDVKFYKNKDIIISIGKYNHLNKIYIVSEQIIPETICKMLKLFCLTEDLYLNIHK